MAASTRRALLAAGMLLALLAALATPGTATAAGTHSAARRTRRALLQGPGNSDFGQAKNPQADRVGFGQHVKNIATDIRGGPGEPGAGAEFGHTVASTSPGHASVDVDLCGVPGGDCTCAEGGREAGLCCTEGGWCEAADCQTYCSCVVSTGDCLTI